MLRLSLFSSRQFDAINVTTVLVYGALAAAGYLFTVQMELKLGYTAAQAGAALIPATGVFVLLSPVSGALVSRLGPRWLMVAGILLIAGAQLWLAQVHAGSHYVEAILPAALLQGLGLGLMVAPLTAAVLAAVGDSDLGEASGINDAAARVGAVVAVALVPALIGLACGQQPRGRAHAWLSAGDARDHRPVRSRGRSSRGSSCPMSRKSQPRRARRRSHSTDALARSSAAHYRSRTKARHREPPNIADSSEPIPTTEADMSTIDKEMVLAHFIVSDDVERSRRFYTDVLGGKDRHLRGGR